MSNYISAALAEQESQEIMNLLAQLKSKLTFNVNLTKEQFNDIPKLSDGRLPFTQKSLNHGRQEPKIIAPLNDLAEMEQDLKFFSALGPIEDELHRLTEMVTIARAAAGCDAFSTALDIYNTAQRAAKKGHAGAQTIVDDLKPLFERQGKKKQ